MLKMRLTAIVLVMVYGSVAALPKTELIEGFQEAVHNQDLHSILTSIEERLRNLDTIYSMQLSPTLEEKLGQYHRKLESLDTKIIHLEALVMLNLDKITENISTKNFKEDVARTNSVKKVDAVYEGISHRLNYLERKLESGTNKIQVKLEATLARLERMDESFTTKNEEMEIEMSDAVAAIEDMKNGFGVIENNIVNNTNEYYEVSLKEHMSLMKNFNDKTNKALEVLHQNVTKQFDHLQERIAENLEAINETDRLLGHLKVDVKRELNEYAVKVAEMNSENWKAGLLLQNQQKSLETAMDATRSELRTLMVLVGKIPNKEQVQQDQQLIKLNEKIDTKFEKVFSSQNLFLDSCYRLQMDESQIESRISDILEKLIETFEKKTSIEVKDIRNLEKIIRAHDAHITKNMHQANTNIVTVYEKMIREHGQFSLGLKEVSNHLNSLFTLIREERGGLSLKNVNLFNDLKEITEKITSLNKQGEILVNSVEEIKTRIYTENFKNLSRALAEINMKIESLYPSNLTQFLCNTNNTKTQPPQEDIDRIVFEMLGINNPSNTTNSTNYDESISLIDVRSGVDFTETTTETEQTSIKGNEELYDRSSDFQQILL